LAHNALTGTYRQINQTRFCDLVNNWRRRGCFGTVPDEGLFLSLRSVIRPGAVDFGFQPGSLHPLTPIMRKPVAAIACWRARQLTVASRLLIFTTTGACVKSGSLGDFVF
jgi:hypothetical protein